VLFTAFTHHRTLAQLLAQFGDSLAPVLQASGLTWQTLTSEERRHYALQLAGQLPLLWIWDNIEPITGFPPGASTPWTAAEQAELVGFLRDLADTRARVLLTSRRDEQAWLRDLPARVELTPMPLRERFALAQALAAKHPDSTGRRRALRMSDWRPLLRFSGGNPLTLTVLVGQAMRRHLGTGEQLAAFVAALEEGRSVLESAEDRAQGRTASLAASLDYGFAGAFTDLDRAQLALLHLFRGSVDADALVEMGASGNPDRVPQLAGLSRRQSIGLLDRAAEIGLLTALGSGYYSIHPALPWYFAALFANVYGPADSEAAQRAVRAYTTAYAGLSAYYHDRYEHGQPDVIGALAVEEDNLLQALHLARTQHNWDAATSAAQGLRQVYTHQGRATEWGRLVDQLTADLIDPATDRSRPGTDDQYGLITEYRVRIALAARDWPTATRLQSLRIAWTRDQAATAITIPADQLNPTARNRIRSLAVSVELLGTILRAQGDPDCLAPYEEALDLYRRIDARFEQANVLGSVGNAHLEVPDLRDLDRAQQAYQAALGLRPQQDTIGRARNLGQLAAVDYGRFREARDADADLDVLVDHLTHALTGYHTVLDLLPVDDPTDRATAHNQLGIIYKQAGDIAQALTHYQQSIHYEEQRGNTYGAGNTRYNIALMLYQHDQLRDALDWARAADRDYEQVGPGATAELSNTRQLIGLIDQQLTG
jgi:tetratricopeptide (TPR) repeat protein